MTRPHVSVSSIRDFLRCRQAWQFSSYQGYNLSPRRPNKHLLLGSAIHEALAAYYKRKRLADLGRTTRNIQYPRAAYEIACNIALDKVRKSNLGDVSDAVLQYVGLGRNMLEQYQTWAPVNDDFEVLAVEHYMVIPVHHFDFVGIADALIKKKSDGTYWILEHKTYTRVPEYRELLFSLQGVAYMWAAQKEFDVPIDGVLFNILLKKEVKAPKVLQSGRISRDKRQSTTREKVEEAIASLGLDRQDYVEFMAKLGKNKYNVRIPVVPTDAMLNYWERQLTAIGTHMLGNPMITPAEARSCTWCDYNPLCERVRNGMKWQPIARFDYVERKRLPIGDVDASTD